MAKVDTLACADEARRLIDLALPGITSRDLVSSLEVSDLLLDIRLLLEEE